MPDEDLSAAIERIRRTVPDFDALDAVAGVRAVSCDESNGEIRLELKSGSHARLLSTVRAILDRMGHPVAAVRA